MLPIISVLEKITWKTNEFIRIVWINLTTSETQRAKSLLIGHLYNWLEIAQAMGNTLFGKLNHVGHVWSVVYLQKCHKMHSNGKS